MVAVSQDFIEELPENDRSRFGLSLGGVLASVQNNQVDDPALLTVKRAHDRYGNLTGFISPVEWHDDRCHVIKQSLWPDTKHMAEKTISMSCPSIRG